MRKIEEIKRDLSQNSELDKNLSLLVDISIKNKTLKFENLDGLDVKILINSEILKFSSGSYRLNQYSHFGYKFYQKYKSLLKVKLTKNFKTTANFLNKLDLEFNVKYNQGFSSLKKELWAFAILETNKKFNIDFANYIDSLDLEKNREEIFSFNEAYSLILPFIKIDIEPFYANSKQLIKWTNSDADYNFPLGELLKGMRERTFQDDKFGLECFEFACNQEDIEVDLLIPLISGLYNKLGMSFYKSYLAEISSLKEEYSIAIICGLSNVELIGKDEAELFLQLYRTLDKSNPKILIQLPKLLFAILRSNKFRKNSKYFKSCFLHLNELISLDNQNIIYFILRNQEFKRDHVNDRLNLILNLIEKPHFSIEKHLKLIDQFFWDQKDIKIFEKVINSLADNCAFQPVTKYLNTSVHEFMRNNKVNFDECLIKQLIHDKASHRFLGLNIFNEISQHNYTFAFDILTLNYLEQYKLWIAICQNYREPKFIIPCLIPLFKSSSSIVKEAFICKMEEYSENYGGFVTEAIKSNIDVNDKELKKIFERIEKYRDQFYSNNALIKQDIKELNPFYTQYKSIRLFDRFFQKQMNQSFEEAEKNSFMSILGVNKVKLAKGGGWKVGNRKEISKLGSVGTSFSLPRDYYINPTEFDLHNNYEMHRDWTDSDFTLIKDFLENE